MLDVYLLKQGTQNAVKLSLPATDYKLPDALEKAGITNKHEARKIL